MMTRYKHTSGEWIRDVWRDDRDQSIKRILVLKKQVTDEGYPVICECYQVGDDYEQALANALLIAIVPELLEALERCVSEMTCDIDWNTTWLEIVEQSRQIIAKAKGE